MNPLDRVFAPRSVAIIGASPDAGHIGGIAFRNLLHCKSLLFPVNPHCSQINGIRCYPSIDSIPEPVDVSVILRPAQEVPGLLKAHAGKTGCAVIVSSGFAEIGESQLQEEVRQEGRIHGIRLIGPNCLGVFNPYHRLDTFFLPPERFKRPGKGNVAVVSQSGGLLICILEALALVRRGVSRGINYGNAVDVDAAEIYEYLAEDDDTGVVVSYLESVGDGRRFIEAAKALSKSKPLLVLKAGKGEGGQSAAYSHTGRLSGKYEVFSSILRLEGIREVRDFDELLDSCHALSQQRQSPGRRVCIVTNAGGLGVLAADECSRRGLYLPPLPDPVRAKLTERYPHFYGFGNPIDLTGQVVDEEYLDVLKEVEKEFDGFIVIAHTGVAGVTPQLADLLSEFRRFSKKPVTAHLAPGGITTRLTPHLEKYGIPVFPSPERSICGLMALLEKEG